MMTIRIRLAGVLLAMGTLLAGCGDGGGEQLAPPPQAVIPQDAVGHYCGMYLFEHKGPKGQILLRDRETPVWFTTIREVFAYIQLPEEPKTIVAAYVQDMARMQPDGTLPDDSWMSIRDAWYVIHSRYAGGMGTLDALPFSTQEAAQAFQEREGGKIVRFDDMPDNYIFGLPELPASDRPTTAGAPPSELERADALPAGAPE